MLENDADDDHWGYSLWGRESHRNAVSRYAAPAGLRKVVLAQFDELVQAGIPRSKAGYRVLKNWALLDYYPEGPVVNCPVCGMMYVEDGFIETGKHVRHHQAALAAREALVGVGPCPLPVSYEQREDLKSHKTADPLTRRHNIMWSHFARSLASWEYDLAAHPSWLEYATAYLSHTHWYEAERPVLAQLAIQLGVVPAPHRSLPNGMSTWEKPD